MADDTTCKSVAQPASPLRQEEEFFDCKDDADAASPHPELNRLHSEVAEIGAAALRDFTRRLGEELAELLRGVHRGARDGPQDPPRRPSQAHVAVQAECGRQELKQQKTRRGVVRHGSREEEEDALARRGDASARWRSLREAKGALERTVRDKEEQLSRVQRDSEDMFKQVLLRETELKHARADKEALQRSLSDKEEQLSHAQREKEEMGESASLRENELRLAKVDKEGLERSLLDKEERLSCVEREKEAVLESALLREKALQHARVDKEALERSLLDREEQLSCAEREKEALEKALQHAKVDKEELEEALSKKEELVRSVRREAKEMLQRALLREKALKHAKVEKEELEKRMQAEIEECGKQLQGLRIEKQVEAEKYEKELERLRLERQRPSQETTVGLTWEFQGNDGKWIPYTPDNSDAITQSFLQRDRVCSVVHDGSRYEIVLQESEMVQTNCVTGKRRKIRYTLGIPEHWAMGDEAVVQQLMQWRHGWGSPGGAQGSLTIEAVLKPVTEEDKLSKFNTLLRESVFHHGKWQGRASRCNELRRKFVVCEAYHVENFLLHQGYRNHCRHLQNKHLQTGVTPVSISAELPAALQRLGGELGIASTGLNELLLFHGTSFDTAKQIALEGFDSRLAKASGMYGQGTYFATQSCKSHKYTETGEPIQTMLLARVALGDPYFTQRCDRYVRRPPRREEHEGSPLYDSIIASPGPKEGHHQREQSHQEFVIFEQMQAYPEYILRYKLE